MMKGYRGPVTVKSAAGDVLGHCRAALDVSTSAGGRRSWAGELACDDEAVLARLFDVSTLQLEFPGGGKADAVCASYNDGDGAVEVLGVGPLPF